MLGHRGWPLAVHLVHDSNRKIVQPLTENLKVESGQTIQIVRHDVGLYRAAAVGASGLPNGTLNQLQAAPRTSGDAARPLPRLTKMFGRSDLQRT
jgi:hypothetical protein